MAITRRRFITTGAAAGAAVGFGGGILYELGFPPSTSAEETTADLAAFTGSDPFANATAAVERIGGMKRFVSRGDTVMVNANTAFQNPGSIVDPAVTLAVLSMCYEAGAKEVRMIKPGPPGYWSPAKRYGKRFELSEQVEISKHDYRVVEPAGAISLKRPHVDRQLLESDVYINLAIVKDHAGSGFSATLKNAMGATPHDPTCKFCHFNPASNSEGWYDDVKHLSQCIADLNLVRAPELCVVDATRYLTTNGPFGPGDLRRADTVVAGTDPVAVDAYSTSFLDLEPDAVAMIELAQRHGIGNADLEALLVVEAA